jgi:HEAT repeat protein
MSGPDSSKEQTRAGAKLSAEVEQAFSALSKYDRGSSRAVLLALDQAVANCAGNESTRKELERRMIAVLSCGSEVARDYACVKLALIGAEASVPPLANLLQDPKLATAARTALEGIPSDTATRVLQGKLSKLENSAKVGAVTSLGVRCDSRSTRVLVAQLRDTDPQVQSAAAAALGELGSTGAAKALKAFLTLAPAALRQPVADAMLRCATRLSRTGRVSDAQALYTTLLNSVLPRYIVDAANRGLAQANRPPRAR